MSWALQISTPCCSYSLISNFVILKTLKGAHTTHANLPSPLTGLYCGRSADPPFCRPADTLYEGAILKARLIFPPVSLLTLQPYAAFADVFSKEYPILPPRMVFDSEMWHPNGRLTRLFDLAADMD